MMSVVTQPSGDSFLLMLLHVVFPATSRDYSSRYMKESEEGRTPETNTKTLWVVQLSVFSFWRELQYTT